MARHLFVNVVSGILYIVLMGRLLKPVSFWAVGGFKVKVLGENDLMRKKLNCHCLPVN